MRRIGLLIVGMFLLGFHSPVWGDATIESTIKSGGFKGMGAFEGATTRKYQGEKMWDSSSSKFTGAILSRFAGGSESATITRVDKGVYWILDPKNKTYVERPIEAFKRDETGKEGQAQEKPRVRVTKSEFSVKKTGASETIKGFPCEEYLVTWLLESAGGRKGLSQGLRPEAGTPNFSGGSQTTGNRNLCRHVRGI